MDKMKYCAIAHKEKDALMEDAMKLERMREDYPDQNHDPQTVEEWLLHIAKSVDYLKYRAICKDNIHEATRENVWEPYNATIREADGLIEPKFMSATEHKTVEHLDHSKIKHSEFADRIKGKDIYNVMAVVGEFAEMLKAIDQGKHRALMAELDKII